MSETVINQAHKLAIKLLGLLQEGQKLFPNLFVPRDLLRSGYTLYRGIIVPLQNVSHRYLYEYYDCSFLAAYISLFKKLLEERGGRLSEFAFRTILEMGVEESYILFDKNVVQEKKHALILCKTLVDYFSIEMSMRKYFAEWLKRLFEENRPYLHSNLSLQEFNSISRLYEAVSKPIDTQFTRVLLDTRNLCNRLKNDLLNKQQQSGKFVLSEGYRRMKSGEAHTLHGNVFLMPHRLEQQSDQNHLFRVYSYLTISGNDLLKRLSEHFGNPNYIQLTQAYFDEFERSKVLFAKAWEKA